MSSKLSTRCMKDYEEWLKAPEKLVPGSSKSREMMLKNFRVDLELAGLPPLHDESTAPCRPPARPEPTVVFMSMCGGMRMSHLLEGGRQSSGNVLLVVCPSWLEKQRDSPDDTLAALYCNTGISFDECGQATLRHYQPPRLVTYFVNMFTFTMTEGWNDGGVVYETGVHTPISASPQMNLLVGDKLYSRQLLAESTNVNFARTLALLFCAKNPAAFKSLPPRMTVHHFTDRLATPKLFTENIREFLANATSTRIVVKPSGATWSQSQGVSFHQTTDLSGIVEAVHALAFRLDPGEGVLLEEFILSIDCTPPSNRTEFDRAVKKQLEEDGRIEWASADRRAHRLRVVVQRTPTDEVRACDPACGIGRGSEPIGGHNTFPMPFDEFANFCSVPLSQRDSLLARIKHDSEQCLQALLAPCDALVDPSVAPRAALDAIGLDIILSTDPETQEIVPYIVEMNDHDSTVFSQRLSTTVPSRYWGAFVRTWITTALHKSVRYLSARLSHRPLQSAPSDNPQALELATARVSDVLQTHSYLKYVLVHLKRWCNFKHSPGRTALETVALSDVALDPAQQDAPIQLDTLTFPAVCRARQTGTGEGATLLFSAAHLSRHLREHPQLEKTHVLQTYACGSEHGLILTLFEGRIIASNVLDYACHKFPSLALVGARLPSQLSHDAQESLVQYGASILHILELHSGVFFLRVRRSLAVPHLISIDLAPWKTFLASWVSRACGYDLVEHSTWISQGLRPPVPLPPSGSKCCVIVGAATQHTLSDESTPLFHSPPLISVSAVSSSAAQTQLEGALGIAPLQW